MARNSNKKRHGKSIGFGLFYLRKPFQYTESEFKAEPANKDRVRTVDLKESDRAEWELCDDDLHKESDWYDRTSINPMIWTAQKQAEAKMASRRGSKNRKVVNPDV